MSTDRVDIADLVAKLDAAIKPAYERELAGFVGTVTCRVTTAIELRRIVVAAKEYAEAEEALSMASVELNEHPELGRAKLLAADERFCAALAELGRAVRGEA